MSMKPKIKNAFGLIACMCAVALFGALIASIGFLRSSTVASDQTGMAVAQVNAALSGKMKNHHDGLLWLAAQFLKNADGAANQIKQTAGDANKIAKQQEPKVAALTDATVALVRSGNDTVAKLGKAATTLDAALALVKTDTIPKVTLAATDALGAYAALPRAFQPTVDQVNLLSGPLLRNSLGTIAAAKVAMGDVAKAGRTFEATSLSIDAAAKNSAEASKQSAILAQNLAKATKPLPTWLRIGLAVAPSAAQTAFPLWSMFSK
jgi:hypothetical protein